LKDDNVFLKHILESIVLIEQYIQDISKDDFLRLPVIQDAVIRRFEVIGEATKNISKATRLANSKIPWKIMAGMRDVLIHEYFGVDLDEVWDTCINDLPELKEKIQKIVK